MSLGGRRLIDGLKSRVSRWLTLPCPPYGSPTYWEGVYKTLGPNDVFEWGNVSLQGLLKYDYRMLHSSSETSEKHNHASELSSSTFAESIGVDPSEAGKSILLLGCGNSKLGEDMAEYGWQGPLIQVDIVSRLLNDMSERCSLLVEDGIMDFVLDDATQLSAFDNDSLDSVIDKGLVDALFCADQYDQAQHVAANVHRVLKPGGVWCLLTLSQPDFLLPHVTLQEWNEVQVRQLETILMYRLQKGERSNAIKGPNRESLQKKKRRKQ